MQEHVLGDFLNCCKPSQHSTASGPALASSLCSGAVCRQENVTSPAIEACTCPVRLYDTQLNTCVLCIVMLDLLFCSTVVEVTFTNWFVCRHRRGCRNLPFQCWHLTSPAQKAFSMEKPSTPSCKASSFLPQEHTHFINESYRLPKW